MKTWDDWSDFDLSLAVAKLAAHDGAVEHNGSAVHVHQYNEDLCLGWKTFDINSPADMWPIIVDSRININAYEDQVQGWFATTDTSFFADHENPLRAAAIAFLMMSGVNP